MSSAVTPLPPNQIVSDSVAARMWKFYLLNLSTSVTSLVFSLNQTSGGDCDLYIRVKQPPSRYEYDARDISTSTQMSISWPNAAAGSVRPPLLALFLGMPATHTPRPCPPPSACV